MHKDSAFAIGSGIKYLRYPAKISEVNMNPKIFEAMSYFNEAEILTATTVSMLLRCSRMVALKLLKKMWQAHLIKCIEIVTYSNPERVFKLWVASNKNLPKIPNEACRMAALSTFYSRTKNVLPGFSWELIRRNKERKVYAHMSYYPLGEKKEAKLLIDAPRRGEKLNINADVYIFPNIREAKMQTPNGKRYTTDYILMNRDIEFENIISDPVGTK